MVNNYGCLVLWEADAKSGKTDDAYSFFITPLRGISDFNTKYWNDKASAYLLPCWRQLAVLALPIRHPDQRDKPNDNVFLRWPYTDLLQLFGKRIDFVC